MSVDDAIGFLESIFGSFGLNAGVPAEAVETAEARLGLALPRALVVLYRRTGLLEALHASHNRLVSLDRIDFAGDHLVFYEENQSVVLWGIARDHLSEDDPPVDQGQWNPEGPDGWSYYPEFRSVSTFARAQGAWQAVQGGLPWVGVMEKYPGANPLPLGPPSLITESMTAWLVDGGVVVSAGDGYVGMATRDADSFSQACSRLGVDISEWDYATLRDGDHAG